jgi:hypothetical protein
MNELMSLRVSLRTSKIEVTMKRLVTSRAFSPRQGVFSEALWGQIQRFLCAAVQTCRPWPAISPGINYL